MWLNFSIDSWAILEEPHQNPQLLIRNVSKYPKDATKYLKYNINENDQCKILKVKKLDVKLKEMKQIWMYIIFKGITYITGESTF